MQQKFDEMSNEITSKMDEMGFYFLSILFNLNLLGNKINLIEKTLVELMNDMEIDENDKDL